MHKASSSVKRYSYTRTSSQFATIFEFTTDSGLVYGVYFVGGEKYLANNPNYRGFIKEFGFDIISANHSSDVPTRDVKVKYTILAILKEYVDNNIHSSIIYVCDYSDGRQQKRSGLFNRWFDEAENSEYKPDVPITKYIIPVDVENEYGETVKTDVVLLNLETCLYSKEFVSYLLGN